ncbi:hypothetical protein QZH41_008539 [Actinostola sp. cb2023]|nr:hypothetical protein QZH41_008539 [Actinostola sp. cb2023]
MRESNMSVTALVGSFDDIVRSASVLSEGIEGEFLKFVIQQEECRKKWLETEANCLKLKQEIAKLKADNETLDVKLKHARNQIEIEIKRRMKAEAAQDHLDRQVALIRELLTDKDTMSRLNENERQTLMQSIQISHLQTDDVRSPRKRPYGIDESSASILSPSDISYDTTADDLVSSCAKKPCVWHSPEPTAPSVDELSVTPPKRIKTTFDHVVKETIVAGTQITISPDGPIKVSAYVKPIESPKKTIRPEDIDDVGLPKSNLYPALPISRTPTIRYQTQNLELLGMLHWPFQTYKCIYVSPHFDASFRLFTLHPGSDILSVGFNNGIKTGKRKKSHLFCSKTVIRPESCQPCGKRIKFGKLALKCKDCRAVCHPDCKDTVPLPCIPSNLTPGSAQKRPEETIDFYAPSTSPMVPVIIVHCVQEIEKRGLTELGLYRVPGSIVDQITAKYEFCLKRLYEMPPIICGVLKDFLRHLAEPIITYRLWPSFTNAAVNQDDNDSNSGLYQAVSELPQANRDTLAFMMKHLQRVSHCPECKMPASNLAKVFGPTLIGHSSPNIEPIDMLREIKILPIVVEKLMQMPADYWNQFLCDIENMRSPPFNPNTHRSDGTPLTPECRPIPQSMLGPISTPNTATRPVKKKGSILSRTPLTPR